MATVNPGSRLSFAVRLAPILFVLSLATCGGGLDAPSPNPSFDSSSTTSPDSGDTTTSDPSNPEASATVARAGTDTDVAEGQWLALDGSASSGSDVQFAWRQLVGPTVEMQGADSESPGFTAPSVAFDEKLRFELTVTGSDGASSVDRVDVTVRAQKTVFLVVDAQTQTALASQLELLRGDVARSLGATARVLTTPATPQALRELLRNAYEGEGLRGALLIGDVPVAYQQSLQDSSIVHLSDSIYRELYCPLQATFDPKVFQFAPSNSINFNCLPTIWVGRIKATRAQDALTQISGYLQRNHALRDAYDDWDERMTFVSAMAIDDPADYASIVDDAFSGHPLYSPAQVTVSQDPLAAAQKQAFVTGLNSRSEILKANFHGAPYYVWFQGQTTGDYLDSGHLQGIRARPRYVELESCSTGAFDTESYFAGEILFGGDTLLVQANPMVSAFFSGAFEQQVNSVYRGYALGWTPAQLYVFSFMGSPRHFLGDPTVALRPRNTASAGPRLRVNTREYLEPFALKLAVPDSVSGEATAAVLEFTNSGNSRLALSARSDVADANTVSPNTVITSTTGFVFTMQTENDPINFALNIELQPGESKQVTVRFNPGADNTPRASNAEYMGVFRFTSNAPDTPAFVVAVSGVRR